MDWPKVTVRIYTAVCSLDLISYVVGLLEGDEILAVNGTSVDELGIAEALTIIESACFGISGLLSLTVRSRRLEMPVFQKTTDSLINHLILPPPERSALHARRRRKETTLTFFENVVRSKN